MKKKTIELIICPNSGTEFFTIFAIKYIRKGTEMFYSDGDGLLNDDDIVEGILINKESESVFLIVKKILVLLADDDVDIHFFSKYYEDITGKCPRKYELIIKKYKKRILDIKKSHVAKWNIEEMRYYDSEVDSEEKRLNMVRDIKKNPIWNIFIPRKKYITSIIGESITDSNLLEIGCGNSRTISNVFHPAKYRYNYIGLDISFNRLLVATLVIPEGDFIQGSAQKIPFKTSSIKTVISFGMIHHLPDPFKAVKNITPAIISGGYFGFHEPIKKPKLLSEKSVLHKIANTYEHSEHDNEINAEKTIVILKKLGFKKKNIVFTNTVLRTTLYILLKIFPDRILNNSFTVKAISFFDRLFLKIFCRLSKKLGPHAIFALFKKE